MQDTSRNLWLIPGASRLFDLVVLSTELASRGHDVLLVSPNELSQKIDGMLNEQTSDGGDGSIQAPQALCSTR